MDKKARFMEAVAQKVGKRTPMMRRKGPPAVVIAIGAPKPGPMEKSSEDEAEGEEMKSKMPVKGKAAKIAALQEKIAALKAELALLEDEDEMEDEAEDESEDEAESED
jgi:hypothetical protein